MHFHLDERQLIISSSSSSPSSLSPSSSLSLLSLVKNRKIKKQKCNQKFMKISLGVFFLIILLLLDFSVSFVSGAQRNSSRKIVKELQSNKEKHDNPDKDHNQEILSFCGEPGRPPKSQVKPVQASYIDGESVTYTCDEFISLKQHRKCVKGHWIGPTPVCGAAFRDNDVILARYVDMDTGRTTNEYNFSNGLQPFPKFGNSFIAERYHIPVRGEKANNYRVELFLQKEAQIQMVRVSFSVVNHLVNKNFENAEFYVSSVTVARGQECSKIAENSVSPWHFNSTRFDFWFFCRSKDPNRGFKPELDLSDKVIFETHCDIPADIDLATFILAEVYNNNNNRSDPICGLPEVPNGLESRVVNDQSRYSFSCAPNFHKTSTSGGQFHLLSCGHDMNWHGELPVCSPVKRCPLLATERSLLVEVFKYDRIFFTNESDWQPVIGSRAFFRCKDETHIFVGKEIRTCNEEGEWTNSIPNCLASVTSDSLRTTTILIIVFVTLIVTFILSSATIYFFLKVRSPKTPPGGLGFPGLEMSDSAYYADTGDPMKGFGPDGEVYETLEPMEARYTSGYGHENPVLLKTSQFPVEMDSYERIGDFTSGLGGQNKPEVRFLNTSPSDYYDDGGCAIVQPDMIGSGGNAAHFSDDISSAYQPMRRF